MRDAELFTTADHGGGGGARDWTVSCLVWRRVPNTTANEVVFTHMFAIFVFFFTGSDNRMHSSLIVWLGRYVHLI